MTFLRSLSPTSFSEVPHGGFIRVSHELAKRSMIPQVESKQNALTNLCGIVNALCALEDNRLKMITLLVLYFLAQTPSSSKDRIPTNIFPAFPEGASYSWVSIQTSFSHRACHLISSDITLSKWSPGFCCTQSW